MELGEYAGARVWGSLNIHLVFVRERQPPWSQALSGIRDPFISHIFSIRDSGEQTEALLSRSPRLLGGTGTVIASQKLME